MTQAEFDESVRTEIRTRIMQNRPRLTADELNAMIARANERRERPSITPCVCAADDVEPELRRVYPYGELHSVSCQACGRGVFGPNKTEAVAMWNAPSRVETANAERKAWQKEAAALLEALRYMVDVFHDDPESGQSMRRVAVERAQDAIASATK